MLGKDVEAHSLARNLRASGVGARGFLLGFTGCAELPSDFPPFDGEAGTLGLGAKGGGAQSMYLDASKGSGSFPGVVVGGGAGGFLLGPTCAWKEMVGEVGDALTLPSGGSGALRRWVTNCAGDVGNVNLLAKGDKTGEIGSNSDVNVLLIRPTSLGERAV